MGDADGREPEFPIVDGEGRSDSLLGGLILIARMHGLRLTPDSALAGLPLDDGRLCPSLVPRAAQRAGLTTRTVTRDARGLKDDLLPALLLLDQNEAWVLVGWNEDKSVARVIDPELGDAVIDVPLKRLKERYVGRAIYVRPEFRMDARAPRVSKESKGHWFWRVIRENRPLYRDVLIAAVMINLFALAMPLFVLNVYDRVVPNHATETLFMFAAGVVIVLIADLILRTMRSHFVDKAAMRADVKLSSHIMERVLGIRMANRPASVGSFASNLGAFESVRSFISSATVIAFVDLPFAVLFIAIIALIAWPLAIPVLIGATLLLLYALVIHHRLRGLAEEGYRMAALRNSTLVESLAGVETVKAVGAEGRVQASWEQATAHLARTHSKSRQLNASVSSTATWAQHSVGVAIIVMGVFLVIQGDLSHGGLIAAYLVSSRAMSPIGQTAGLLTHYHQAAAALKSLNRIMELPVERPPDSGFLSREGFQGEIEFRNVDFAYPNQSGHALKGVTLRIAAGEHVAVLGRVGSGKSTLAKLILGLYEPTGGAVLVDGVDVRQLDPAELRRSMGYVGQEITLFYGSLRDNVVASNPLASDEAIRHAVAVSGIEDLINTHPEGIDMGVGERGALLSGGQKQCVGIARAVLHEPNILLLDEPTSAMDNSTEQAVKRSLKAFMGGRTALVVTHRTSLLDLVDRVIVLDQGRVVADGPKQQVIQALRDGRIGKAQS
ncbi:MULTISPECIES: type I secretion system permease/ATPase [unclassified Thioalkalivibrio]|uniref:type I secretion system permease/ATPase n=1 Tax=unclassified Thioalkalivibrio TaxID=2621013 RepID=UPI0003758F5B|nr:MULTISPECIES: type I secretion system permease/ATPase [unclassified Thioalkalivibrio]